MSVPEVRCDWYHYIRSELKIFTSTETIERQKENWYEHILRMRTHRFPNLLLNYKPRRH
jgi:hypothetical protein